MDLKKITCEIKDGIYFVGFGKDETKSLTVITEQTLRELDQVFTDVAGDKNAKGLALFSHRENCFLAGMDVSVIQSLSSVAEATSGCEQGQSVFNK